MGGGTQVVQGGGIQVVQGGGTQVVQGGYPGCTTRARYTTVVQHPGYTGSACRPGARLRWYSLGNTGSPANPGSGRTDGQGSLSYRP